MFRINKEDFSMWWYHLRFTLQRFLSATLVATFALLLPLSSLLIPAHAAASTAAIQRTLASPPPYQVHGQVKQISSQEAYPDATGAYFFNVTQQIQQLTSVSYFVVTGQPSDGQDLFHLQVSKSAVPQIVRVIEIASNPDAHTQLIAVGIATTVPSDQPTNGNAASSATTQGKRSTQTGQAKLTGDPCVNGYLRTYWYDPLGIEVNEVKDSVNWCYTGTVVSSFSGHDNRWWLTETGWYEVYGGHNQSLCGCFTWGEYWTNDRMVNPNFAHTCDETDVYYRPNGYIFYGDGTSQADLSTWVSGSCYFLLHYAIDII
jgi:hypothetical protein